MFWVAFLGAVPWVSSTSILGGIDRPVADFSLPLRWHCGGPTCSGPPDPSILTVLYRHSTTTRLITSCGMFFQLGNRQPELGPTVAVWSMGYRPFEQWMGSWDNWVSLGGTMQTRLEVATISPEWIWVLMVWSSPWKYGGSSGMPGMAQGLGRRWLFDTPSEGHLVCRMGEGRARDARRRLIASNPP